MESPNLEAHNDAKLSILTISMLKLLAVLRRQDSLTLTFENIPIFFLISMRLELRPVQERKEVIQHEVLITCFLIPMAYLIVQKI